MRSITSREDRKVVTWASALWSSAQSSTRAFRSTAVCARRLTEQCHPNAIWAAHPSSNRSRSAAIPSLFCTPKPTHHVDDGVEYSRKRTLRPRLRARPNRARFWADPSPNRNALQETSKHRNQSCASSLGGCDAPTGGGRGTDHHEFTQNTIHGRQSPDQVIRYGKSLVRRVGGRILRLREGNYRALISLANASRDRRWHEIITSVMAHDYDFATT